MKEINVFYHAYCVNDCYERFIKTYNKMSSSGLLKDAKNIHVVLVGEKKEEIQEKIEALEKVNCIVREKSSGEVETLHYLWEQSQTLSPFCGLYLHSKGASHGYNNTNIDSWIEYMEYFCITRYKDSINRLNEYDTCGVNLQSEPLWHYSGNFWWANSSYIKTLSKLDVTKSSNPSAFSERWYCEFWLFDKMQARAYSMHQSSVNHYSSVYPKNNYIKEINYEHNS